MKTGIIVAMDSEYRALLEAGVDPSLVLKAGIGKVNAAICATKLILEKKPDCIVSSGVAGGIGPSVRPGDFVLALRTAYHDVWCGEPNAPGQVQGLPVFFDADPGMIERFKSIEKPDVRIHEGLVCTGDRFLETPVEASKVKELYPDALACDMESAAIAQVCHRFAVPFLSFRAISDSIDTGLDHQQHYESFWRDLSSRSFEMLGSLLKSF